MKYEGWDYLDHMVQACEESLVRVLLNDGNHCKLAVFMIC